MEWEDTFGQGLYIRHNTSAEAKLKNHYFLATFLSFSSIKSIWLVLFNFFLPFDINRSYVGLEI